MNINLYIFNTINHELTNFTLFSLGEDKTAILNFGKRLWTVATIANTNHASAILK